MADQTKFAELIGRHKGILYKVSRTYCRDEEDRKDLMQEIAIQIWKSLDRYDPQFKESTWVYRIALNVSISFYRKDRRRSEQPLTDEILNMAEEKNSSELETHIQALYEFIGQLDPLNKALILLYLDDHSQKDISEILGLTVTNVATKISRIKQQLKKQFSDLKG